MQFLRDFEAKEQILEIGRRMYAKNYVAANDGNITCKTGPDTIWATPTGVSKGYMKAEELVKMRLDGTVIQQGPLKPSSEIKMHLRVYNENPEVCGVCHAHPPVSTSFAIAGISLDRAIYPEALVNLGTVPCVHYAAPGSQGIPDSVAPYCKSHNALLLANHGALAWGPTLLESWYRLESVEHYAMILMYTGNIIGKANVLSCDQVRELVNIREKLGIRSGGLPSCCVPQATNLTDVGGAQALCLADAPARKDVSAGDIEPLVREVLAALLPAAK
ncbi:MAG: class II aldolase/adducin family protein [Treponema sp.]|nr:class II aldolase/adducin family protein [Treponema sp.]